MTRKKKLPSVASIADEAVSPQPAQIKAPYKIAILGTASTSCHNAPYNDPEWKIWDMSMNFQYGKRFDLFFEIHHPSILDTYKGIDKYLAFLKTAGKAVVAGHPSEYWPEATMLPLQDIMVMFDTDYFTCSAAYMMAFALYLHKKSLAEGTQPVAEVGLWGIDMAAIAEEQGAEYSYQRPCIDYWVGRIKESGIKVTIAPQSPIARCGAMYGFENIKISRDLTEKTNEMKIAIKQLEDKCRQDGLLGITINPTVERLSNLKFALNEMTQHMNRFGL